MGDTRQDDARHHSNILCGLDATGNESSSPLNEMQFPGKSLLKNGVVRKGFLQKRAQGLKRFTRRKFQWRTFVLTKESLSYYIGHSFVSMKLKNSIPIKAIRACEACSGAAWGKRFMFQVVHQKATLYVSAQSEAERQSWISAIWNVCEREENRSLKMERHHSSVFHKQLWLCCRQKSPTARGCERSHTYAILDEQTNKDIESRHVRFTSVRRANRAVRMSFSNASSSVNGAYHRDDDDDDGGESAYNSAQNDFSSNSVNTGTTVTNISSSGRTGSRADCDTSSNRSSNSVCSSSPSFDDTSTLLLSSASARLPVYCPPQDDSRRARTLSHARRNSGRHRPLTVKEGTCGSRTSRISNSLKCHSISYRDKDAIHSTRPSNASNSDNDDDHDDDDEEEEESFHYVPGEDLESAVGGYSDIHIYDTGDDDGDVTDADSESDGNSSSSSKSSSKSSSDCSSGSADRRVQQSMNVTSSTCTSRSNTSSCGEQEHARDGEMHTRQCAPVRKRLKYPVYNLAPSQEPQGRSDLPAPSQPAASDLKGVNHGLHAHAKAQEPRSQLKSTDGMEGKLLLRMAIRNLRPVKA